ncbi:hypothetical protein CBR_g11896 [Chara braunii]|uniref:Uncharacterized protein n=1 Tax=Chara braunii TaxID=69332 RepID=A0A388KQK8_CHABU|nr:hypothetical protein CBR_g11896 [Chara braunii]|eukprot:GBG72317.1 hypothetical protein CBR_g11896 [Chara braunii]
MIGRWVVRLQEYDFDIVHRKTAKHRNADGLTRLHRPDKCTTRQAAEIARYVNRFLGMHQDTEEILTDNGAEFRGEVLRNLVLHNRSAEDEISDDEVELLLIQGWRTDTEGDFLGILFGEVRDGHLSSITDELLVLLTQVLDDLPLEILSHCDEKSGTATLARTLEPHLLWSTCTEFEEGSYYLPSRDAYLVIDVTDCSSWDPLIRRVNVGETSEETEEEEEEEEEQEEEVEEEGEETPEEKESGAESDNPDYRESEDAESEEASSGQAEEEESGSGESSDPE